MSITRSNGSHSESMGTVSAKDKARNAIADKTQAFLDKGGKIDMQPSYMDSQPKARMGFSTSQYA